ncbi:MAG TPA: amidohydrolase family protein [Thermoanaerobaculia bacterium]|nr:amidohydrolase family protein [Thermoanaerobaculia bacterium]
MRFSGKLRLYAVRCTLLLVGIAGVVPVQAQTPKLGSITQIFTGNIRTMDADDRVVEAVGVDARGLIVAVGTESQVTATAPNVKPTRLASGQTLLPGFFDAHVHINALLLAQSGLAPVVGPCRPEPYAAGDSGCKNYIQEAFADLRRNLGRYGPFPVALNLDPSRQPYDKKTTSVEFKRTPATFIAADLSPTVPILILDQSGHFGYANHAAFRKLRETICKKDAPCAAWPPTLTGGGRWVTYQDQGDPCPPGDDPTISCYTGLLAEPPGFFAFTPAIGNGALNDVRTNALKYVAGGGKGVIGTLASLRKAGLTTIVSMAEDANTARATKRLAELPLSGTRMVSIIPPAVAKELSNDEQPILPGCDPLTNANCRLPRDLGVTGIKVISDGSTQGCSAALIKNGPVQYQKGSGCEDPWGQPPNYTFDELLKELGPLWEKGTWRFETHANGNAAFENVLEVYTALELKHHNPHTATVIHATVGDERVWQLAKALRDGKEIGGKKVKIDLRFTHLIGHVAYWGAVLKDQLGAESAANIDPTGWDQKYGIPFTLHSDATVSVPMPLWFVSQAVTRKTWTYPELRADSVQVLGPEHRISIREALRAVTIDAAKEKELDRWLGSIEVGKVADFVLLSADPVSYLKDPDKISSIRVINTYLGGKKTGPDMK